jgi:spore maturation protein CgeD
MSPEITCLIVSPCKPDYVKEAINSVLIQTFQDWNAILIDSGHLYNSGFFSWVTDPRFTIIPSGESPQMRNRISMAPWCFNECFRRGLVHGKYVTYLCDDDIWYDNAFSTFIEFSKTCDTVDAMYASQDVAMHDNKGGRFVVGERRAVNVMGLAAQAELLNCKVDYLQFCHSRRIVQKHSIFWPESRNTETHADGVFMDMIGRYVPVYPIDIKVGQNRRTPLSTYVPTS